MRIMTRKGGIAVRLHRGPVRRPDQFYGNLHLLANAMPEAIGSNGPIGTITRQGRRERLCRRADPAVGWQLLRTEMH